MKAHEIAAKMIAGPDGWKQALNDDLYNRITDAADLVQRMGGELVSRQAIAAVITCWSMTHPGVPEYDRG